MLAFAAGGAVAADAPKSKTAAPAEELWAKRCEDLKDKDGKTVTGQYCEVFQRLAAQEKDKSVKRVVEFAVGYPPDEKTARAVIALPLGILLQEPLYLQIDDKQDHEFHVRYCLADGCYAYLNLPDAVLGELQKGKKITLKSRAFNGQKLHIVMDLKGFAPALEAAKKK